MNPTKSIFAIIMLAASNWYYLHVSAADATSTSHHEATSSEHEIRIIGKDGKLSDKVALTPDDTLVCAIIPKKDVEKIVLEQNSKTTPVVLGGKLEAVPSNSVSQDKEEKIETRHKEPKSVAESETVKADAPVSGEGAVKPPPPTSANETSSTVHETEANHENGETTHKTKTDSSAETSNSLAVGKSEGHVSSITPPAGNTLDSSGTNSPAHITIEEKAKSSGETEIGSLTDSKPKAATSPLNSAHALDNEASKLTNAIVTGNQTDHEIANANKVAALTSNSPLSQLIDLQKQVE